MPSIRPVTPGAPIVRRLLLLFVAALTFVVPATALAVDPTASPAPSATPTVAPTVAPTPAASLRTVPITVAPGQLGGFLAPVPLIFTGPSDTGGTFRIDNPSTIEEHFMVQIADYTIDAAGNVARDNQGNPTTDVPGYAYASAKWYSFPVSDFVLPPGTGRDLHFDLNVPPDALPGDHIAALVVSFQAVGKTGPEGSGGVGLVTTGKILTRMQHRVAGAVPGAPDISLRATSDPGGIHFLASVNNTGNTVLDYKTGKADDPLPNFIVYASEDNNNPIKTIPVDGGFYVLPEGNRIVTSDWTEDLPYTGDYRVVFDLPKRDGRDELRIETTFHYVSVKGVKPADYTLLIIGGVVGVLFIAFLVVLFFLLAGRRRRRAEEAAVSVSKPTTRSDPNSRR